MHLNLQFYTVKLNLYVFFLTLCFDLIRQPQKMNVSSAWALFSDSEEQLLKYCLQSCACACKLAHSPTDPTPPLWPSSTVNWLAWLTSIPLPSTWLMQTTEEEKEEKRRRQKKKSWNYSKNNHKSTESLQEIIVKTIINRKFMGKKVNITAEESRDSFLNYTIPLRATVSPADCSFSQGICLPSQYLSPATDT